MIQREEIEALIPHSGRMCLIDKVLDWDEASINCSTQSHTRADNPLRKDAKLGAVHLLEYGAQAMAIHGALLAKSEGKVLATALLAGAKNVQFYVQRLDDVAAELCVSARQLVRQGGSMMYQFNARAGDVELGSGRVSVVEKALI